MSAESQDTYASQNSDRALIACKPETLTHELEGTKNSKKPNSDPCHRTRSWLGREKVKEGTQKLPKKIYFTIIFLKSMRERKRERDK